MNKPILSHDFTIDDIHKIREYNYETTKNMTENERKNYYKSKAEKVRLEMLERQKEKQPQHVNV